MSRPAPPEGEGRLVVGLVRGGVRVEILSDTPDRFAPGSVLFAEGSTEPLTVARSRADGPGLIVYFAELPDRATVETLRDVYLETEAADERQPDSWYWHEIVGCQVSTTDGELLGAVEDVMRVGEAEVYVVRGARGELLVPAVQAVVRELAPSDGRIVVDGEALGLSEE